MKAITSNSLSKLPYLHKNNSFLRLASIFAKSPVFCGVIQLET